MNAELSVIGLALCIILAAWVIYELRRLRKP